MEAGQKGICRLSVVPVRKEGSDRSEQVSQLLFGDHYEVLEREGNWLRIKIHFDGYEGWIDVNQFYEISDAYFNQINNSDYKICGSKATKVGDEWRNDYQPFKNGSMSQDQLSKKFKIYSFCDFR